MEGQGDMSPFNLQYYQDLLSNDDGDKSTAVSPASPISQVSPLTRYPAGSPHFSPGPRSTQPLTTFSYMPQMSPSSTSFHTSLAQVQRSSPSSFRPPLCPSPSSSSLPVGPSRSSSRRGSFNHSNPGPRLVMQPAPVISSLQPSPVYYSCPQVTGQPAPVFSSQQLSPVYYSCPQVTGQPSPVFSSQQPSPVYYSCPLMTQPKPVFSSLPPPLMYSSFTQETQPAPVYSSYTPVTQPAPGYSTFTPIDPAPENSSFMPVTQPAPDNSSFTSVTQPAPGNSSFTPVTQPAPENSSFTPVTQPEPVIQLEPGNSSFTPVTRPAPDNSSFTPVTQLAPDNSSFTSMTQPAPDNSSFTPVTQLEPGTSSFTPVTELSSSSAPVWSSVPSVTHSPSLLSLRKPPRYATSLSAQVQKKVSSSGFSQNPSPLQPAPVSSSLPPSSVYSSLPPSPSSHVGNSVWSNRKPPQVPVKTSTNSKSASGSNTQPWRKSHKRTDSGIISGINSRIPPPLPADLMKAGAVEWTYDNNGRNESFNEFMILDNTNHNGASGSGKNNVDEVMMITASHSEGGSNANETGPTTSGVKRKAAGKEIDPLTRYYQRVPTDGCFNDIIKKGKSPSPAGNDLPVPGKSLHTSSGLRIAGDISEVETPEAKRMRRILANRESAARSKQRKEQHNLNMENKLKALETQHDTMSRRLADLEKNKMMMTYENNEMKTHVFYREREEQFRDEISKLKAALALYEQASVDDDTQRRLKEALDLNEKLCAEIKLLKLEAGEVYQQVKPNEAQVEGSNIQQPQDQNMQQPQDPNMQQPQDQNMQQPQDPNMQQPQDQNMQQPQDPNMQQPQDQNIQQPQDKNMQQLLDQNMFQQLNINQFNQFNKFNQEQQNFGFDGQT